VSTSFELSFEHKHPVDGFIRLSVNSNIVWLKCHWPFDLESDDWINITNEFRVEDYVQAVRDASEKGVGEAPGLQGGSIEIAKTQDGFRLNFSNSYKGWQQKSLCVNVKRSLASLQLQG
jgi:hypothetical protein